MGRIRRISTDGRQDNQRYKYTAWNPSPLAKCKLSRDEAFAELAKLYFKWIGPATVSNFQWFSGLGVAAAKKVLERVPLVPVEKESEYLMLANELDKFKSFKPAKDEKIALLASIDGLLHLRRNVDAHVHAADRNSQMKGDKVLYTVGDVVDLTSHGIFDRGRLIGLWEFDPAKQEIVWKAFRPASQAVKKAVRETEAFVRDQLGDARSFSLDSPGSRQPKIEFLRSQ